MAGQFNGPEHNGIPDMMAYVLQYSKGHSDSESSLLQRLNLEQTWICRLRTKILDGHNVCNNKKTENKKT